VESLRVYRALLSNRPLTKLLVGEFISGIGDWLYIVAIFVVIYRESNDAALVGAFGAVRMLPYVVLSIPAGLIADRFERRLVLLTSDLFRGSVMIVLTALVIANGPLILIAAFAILAACGSTFFYPAMGAYLPSLVTDERQLGPANSAFASLNNLSFIVGPAIGGLVIAAGGPGGVTLAFVLNAVTFVVIAAILWTLPPSAQAATPTAEKASAFAEPNTGEAETESPAASSPTERPRLQLRPLAGLGITQVLFGFLDGGIQVLTIVLAVSVLRAGEEANGYLNAAIGVGGLAGAIASGALVLRRSLGMPLFVGSVITGIGIAFLGIVPVLGVALVAIGVAAAGSIVMDVVMTTLFQRLVPDELRGRAFGLLMTLGTLSGAIGAFILPVLVQTNGAAPVLVTTGVLVVVAAGIGVLLVGSAATREASPFEATLARVARLPIFTGVPAARLEATLGRLRALPVTAGQTIIRQGDPADRFYIIESGSFSVTQQAADGSVAELRTMGSDEVFGELGLLSGSPRSATVTATSEGTLLELDGPDFLELVGASGSLRGRLLGLYATSTPTPSG
jgi:MFS family permease